MLLGLRHGGDHALGTDASPRPFAQEVRRRLCADAPSPSRSGHAQWLIDAWILPGSYFASVFHRASTMAAICRATVSLARLGFVPFASMRS